MLTTAGIVALIAMGAHLQTDPVDLASVAANESGLKTTAHNPGGDASGLWQLMPSTARGLGWDVDNDPHLDKFRALSDVEQMHWFEKYFRGHTGQMPSGTAVYMSTFCPAWLSHWTTPNWVICGVSQKNPHLSDAQNAQWYRQNRGFDRANRGYIIVQDLTDAIERATAALPGWDALVTAIRALQCPAKPEPPAV